MKVEVKQVAEQVHALQTYLDAQRASFLEQGRLQLDHVPARRCALGHHVALAKPFQPARCVLGVHDVVRIDSTLRSRLAVAVHFRGLLRCGLDLLLAVERLQILRCERELHSTRSRRQVPIVTIPGVSQCGGGVAGGRERRRGVDVRRESAAHLSRSRSRPGSSESPESRGASP